MTWLTSDVNNSELFLPHSIWLLFVKTVREILAKVAMLSLSPTQIFVLTLGPTLTQTEIIWVLMQTFKYKSLLRDSYRPPSTNADYLHNFQSSFSHIHADKQIWIRGHFNLRNIDWTVITPVRPFHSRRPKPHHPPHKHTLNTRDIHIHQKYNLTLTNSTLANTSTNYNTPGDHGGSTDCLTVSHTLDLFLTNNIHNKTNTGCSRTLRPWHATY